MSRRARAQQENSTLDEPCGLYTTPVLFVSQHWTKGSQRQPSTHGGGCRASCKAEGLVATVTKHIRWGDEITEISLDRAQAHLDAPAEPRRGSSDLCRRTSTALVHLGRICDTSAVTRASPWAAGPSTKPGRSDRILKIEIPSFTRAPCSEFLAPMFSHSETIEFTVSGRGFGS
ncbi:hypothetical protein BD289DRAFT_108470 [Coniella lustricola]|uniref:Uncharacterized protein n=1 Tax=Coniella lustricola TaxID=2025994 RepID=A0A2T3AGM4_9PEZI|nr:hypothetical protein BD289DRAFT_108470 [Coniella lustricola]